VILLLLALAAPQADAGALMKAANARLSVAGPAAEPADPAASFRVPDDDSADPRASRVPRAVDATGTSCGTSILPCRRPPRTWLSAPIGR